MARTTGMGKPQLLEQWANKALELALTEQHAPAEAEARGFLADALFYLAKHHDAIIQTETAIKILPSSGLWLRQGQAYLQLAQYDLALTALENALQLARADPIQESLIEVYMAGIWYRTKHTTQALQLLERVRHRLGLHPDSGVALRMYNLLGLIELELANLAYSKHDQAVLQTTAAAAIRHFETALSYCQPDEPQGIISNQMNIGNIVGLLGEHRLAIEKFEALLPVVRQIPDLRREATAPQVLLERGVVPPP